MWFCGRKEWTFLVFFFIFVNDFLLLLFVSNEIRGQRMTNTNKYWCCKWQCCCCNAFLHRKHREKKVQRQMYTTNVQIKSIPEWLQNSKKNAQNNRFPPDYSAVCAGHLISESLFNILLGSKNFSILSSKVLFEIPNVPARMPFSFLPNICW